MRRLKGVGVLSAIWGCVDLSGEVLPDNLCEAMREQFDEYKIDRFSGKSAGSITMGCAIQHITNESIREPLPIFCNDAGVYFTADCILDNRDDLVRQLGIREANIPDGALLFEAYKRWGEETPGHLLGVFSFAVYDSGKNTLMLSADQTFSRSVFYCREGDKVYFSTLTAPIVTVRKAGRKLNDRWIADYMALKSVLHLTEPFETVYDGIYKVKRGQYLIFSAKGCRHVDYWRPESIPPLRLGGDEEYRKRFFSLMETAARQATRTRGEVSVMLSSGYDSTTVASFVSDVMKERGKTLYSFTHVPIDGFKNNLSKYAIPDERSGVESFLEMYPNISPRFLSLPEADAFSAARGFLYAAESPCKAMANTAWVDGFLELARDNGSRIILNGQFGNFTTSVGSIFAYAREMLGRGRLNKAFSALSRYGVRLGISRRNLFKTLMSGLVPDWARRRMIRSYPEGSLINEAFARENGTRKRIHEFLEFSGLGQLKSFSKNRLQGVQPIPFSHIGELDTRMGLRHGVVIRDILRDVRIIEFCLAAPMECFIGPDAIERRMMRVYMRGRIPDMLLNDELRRGVQSADWLERLACHWEYIYPELEKSLLAPQLFRVASEEKLRKLLDIHKTPPQSGDDMDILLLLAAYVMSSFLQLQDN